MHELAEAFDSLWFLLNLVEGVLFLAMGVYFSVKQDGGAFLISNFSHLPKAQRERYDMEGLGKYLRRVFTLCAVVCIAGAFASIPFGPPAYWITTVLWIAVAVATLRVDNEKLLKKYRKEG